MFVVFRTDANPTTGIGHAMRCLALADALAALGTRCLFLSRGAGLGNIAQRISDAGHELATLPEGPHSNASSAIPHHHWLPHGWQHDVALCREQLIGEAKPDWLVLDHYALGADWESAMRDAVGHIIVIDDLADRRHDCDILVDQNPAPNAAARYDGLVPTHCLRLLGPRHGLLRDGFAQIHSSALAHATPKTAQRILVQFGGADPGDFTRKTVDILSQLQLGAHVDVVAGPLYPNIAALETSVAKLPNAKLHINPPTVTALMSMADMAIGSLGTTTWERCCLAVPAIAIAVADNQEIMANILGDQGAHLYLGRAENLSDADLAAAIRLLALNANLRTSIRTAAGALVDGRGAARVAQRMGGSSVILRRAENADAQPLYDWRNDPRIRSQSFDTSPIPWEGHLAWFGKTLQDRRRAMLVAEVGSIRVGCVRFDLNEANARISIYLDPNRVGDGLAIPTLRAAESWLLANMPQIKNITAEVRAGNEASRRSFLGAGYVADHLVLQRPLLETDAPAL